MLSIEPGWYLFKPRDLAVHYWNGQTFTEDISPRGGGSYPVLTWRALRKWKRYDRKTRIHVAKVFIPTVITLQYALPDGYIAF
jgi:hypothetical protein